MRDAPIEWEVAGAAGEPVLGVAHPPADGGAPRCVAIVAHGFKGFMDYGMMPRIARTLADAGLLALRFNFSHSGMTRDASTFARPDRFELDTWNRQVEDLAAVVAAHDAGALPGGGDAARPLVLVGHSRGGLAVLLAAARGAVRRPERIVTIAAPARCDRLGDDALAALRRDGFVETVSARTGQTLRVGRAWIDEQDADPAGHDLLALVAGLDVPLLVLHGADDPTVPATDGERIAAAAPRATLHRIAGANHVLDVVHPLADDAPSPPALAEALDRITAFVGRG